METKTRLPSKKQKSYEQMPAIQRYVKHYLKGTKFYKKISHDIILNGSLTIGDKAVYMAILQSSDYKSFRKLSIETIIERCGMSKAPIIKSIKNLIENGCIGLQKTRYENKYKLTTDDSNYLMVSDREFGGLKGDFRTYIKRLMAIILSSGNDNIPSHNACLKRMGKMDIRLHRELKKKFYQDEENDIVNYIRLDGYEVCPELEATKISAMPPQENDVIEEEPTTDLTKIMDFMNNLYRREFGINSTHSNLAQILKEYSIEDVKLVISNRYLVWKDDKVMQKHLQPSTIFKADKFPKYLEEAQYTKVGKGITEALKIDLKKGDEITPEIAKTFIDEELYSIISIGYKPNGDKDGEHRANMYGKDIKGALKTRESSYKFSGYKEFEYIYNPA